MKDSTKMFMLAALNLLFAMIPPFDWSSGLCIGVAISLGNEKYYIEVWEEPDFERDLA